MTLVTEFFLVGFQGSQHSRTILFLILLVTYCGTLSGNLLIITLVSTSKILHTPMYFFISQLSFKDILSTTDLVPNALNIILHNGGTITFAACITQYCFFVVFGVFECLLLTVMSYDRYLAICNPLRYSTIMTNNHCVSLTIMCWFFSFSVILIQASTILMVTFCEPNTIDHFFCDVVPLIEIACSDTSVIELEVSVLSFLLLFIPPSIIIMSYINIIVTILRFQSRVSRQKAFSTCSSHLIVVSIYFFTPLSVYMLPVGGQTLNIKKLLSLVYTVFTPLINPIIYSLRNKDISKSLQDIIKYGIFNNGISLGKK